jgi:uncharacterized membrane protein
LNKTRESKKKETALIGLPIPLEVHCKDERKTMNRFSLFKEVSFENIEKWLGRKVLKKVDVGTLLLGLAVIVYTVGLSYFTILKNYEFETYAWDLGIFNQSFWTTLHNGRLFYSTAELLVVPSGSFFGTHFSPILFLVLPFYAVYQAPQSLLEIQSFILALGAVPLYALAKRVGQYRVFALSFVLAYMLYPALQGVNWFDFHVESFLPLFFFSVLYFLETQNWKPYFLFIFLSLMSEEHAAFIVAFIGLLGVLQYRKHLTEELKKKNFKDVLFLVSFFTIALAILWYTVVMLVRGALFPVNPAFISTFNAASNWSILGVQNPIMIPFYLFRYPANVAAALSYDIPLKVSYVIALFGPLAFMSFFKLRYLLPTVPWFVLALLSNYQPYYMILFQYPAYVIAFIFVAAIYAPTAIYGIGSGGLNMTALEKRLAILLTFSFIAYLLVSPLSPTVATLYPASGIRPVSQRDDLANQLLSYIPPNASVMADNAHFPQVSSRSNAYVIPTIAPIWNGHVDEVRNFTSSILEQVDYLIVDTKTDPFASSVVFSLMKNSTFKVLASADGVVLFKRNYGGRATILLPYDAKYDYNSLNLYSGELTKSPNSTSNLVLHYNGSIGESLMFWHSPRLPLPPGDYNLTLKLRINGTGELFGIDACTDNGQNVLLSENFSSTEFPQQSDWTNVTIPFDTTQPLADFELRAVCFPGTANMYVDYLTLDQTNPR